MRSAIEQGGTDEQGNTRYWLTLKDGRKLALPHHWRHAEFALEGNVVAYPDEQVIALYDETTRTGAIHTETSTNYWVIWQPTLREAFFGEMVPSHIEATRRWRKESALKNNFHQVAIAHNVGLASIGVSTMARSQAYKSAIQRISQRRL